MQGISNIKYPPARITVFFMLLSVLSVFSGVAARNIFYPNSHTVASLDPTVITSFSTLLSSLAEITRSSAIALAAIYLSAFTMFPTAVAYAVIGFRGVSLGWCAAMLSIGEAVGYAYISLPFFFAANAFTAWAAVSAIWFSNSIRKSGIGYARDIPKTDLADFTVSHLSMSAYVFIAELFPVLVRSALLKFGM